MTSRHPLEEENPYGETHMDEQPVLLFNLLGNFLNAVLQTIIAVVVFTLGFDRMLYWMSGESAGLGALVAGGFAFVIVAMFNIIILFMRLRGPTVVSFVGETIATSVAAAFSAAICAVAAMIPSNFVAVVLTPVVYILIRDTIYVRFLKRKQEDTPDIIMS